MAKANPLILQKNYQLFNDAYGHIYRIDTEKALSIFKKKQIAQGRLGELAGFSAKQGERFINFCLYGASEFKGKKIPLDMIESAKKFGEVLCEDENAFIIDVTNEAQEKLSHITESRSDASISTDEGAKVDIVASEPVQGKGIIDERVKKIYAMLNGILYEMKSSQFYNYIPDDPDGDGFEYYGKRLSDVQMNAHNLFIGDACTRKKIFRIIDEVSHFVKSYSIPGAAERWLEINPNLCYYDVSYDFYNENKELYDAIVSGGYGDVRFAVMPTAESLEKRNIYFYKMKALFERRNEKYDEELAFQEEMIRTLEMVFEQDFADGRL